MPARIRAVSAYLPEQVLTNEDLHRAFPDWDVEKIFAKTGIERRHIAGEEEFTSDLATAALRTVLQEHDIGVDEIDYLIVCTQTPDHLMPPTASIVHGMLALRTDAGAIDINLGCSGYIYGLGLASGLIDSGQASTVALVTADTYSKLLNPADRSVRTIFGDGATATVLVAAEGAGGGTVSSFVYGSEGSGGGALVVPTGGLRKNDRYPDADPRRRGLEAGGFDLFMDGPRVFDFTLRVVPGTVERVLRRYGATAEDIDTWVFHQANAFMLNHLRRRLGIQPERFVVDISETGNTVSSTIPLVLARQRGRFDPGSRTLLLGFGVGLSWGGAVVDW